MILQYNQKKYNRQGKKENAAFIHFYSLDYFSFSYHFEVMNHCLSGEYSAIPKEYRRIAEALFPDGDLLPNAAGFADALGIGAEYKRLLGVKADAAQMHKFLGHFQNNLDLLIQKTWVEKTEVARKNKLQDDIIPFTALIEQGKLLPAIEKFGVIIEELAYLFFGRQSSEEDFFEYTFRVDEQMGLFWWYGTQLGSLKKKYKNSMPGDDILWAILLIGLCYLTNF